MKTIFFISMMLYTFSLKAQINEYTKPVENNLEQYQPTPVDQIASLRQMAYNNAIAQAKADIKNFLEYYNSIKSFNDIQTGGHDAKLIFNSEMITNGKVFVSKGRIFEIDVAGANIMEVNGLKVNSEVVNGHSKVFLVKNDNYTPIDVYILDSFK